MKFSRTIIAGLFLVFTAFFITGCGTPQYVRFPDQSVRLEDPSKARIYVVRPPAYGGSAVKMKVYDGGTYIGKTRAGGYLCWEREAGLAVIVGKASNRSKFEIEVQPGDVVYIGQMVLPGIPFARNKLKHLKESEGEHRLKLCIPPRRAHR